LTYKNFALDSLSGQLSDALFLNILCTLTACSNNPEAPSHGYNAAIVMNYPSAKQNYTC